MTAAQHDQSSDARLLALGDSYTIGEGVMAAERWPAQLIVLLRQQGVDVADPIIVARSGWTTDELSAAIDATSIEGTFEIVTLLIGVNNQYRGRTRSEYREQFRMLLQRAAGFAAGRPEHVLVLSIPDWGATPFAADHDRQRIAIEIDAFNAINHDEAERAGAQYVDVTPASREKTEWIGEAVVADGLHPSATMYAKWAHLALPAALRALGQSGGR